MGEAADRMQAAIDADGGAGLPGGSDVVPGADGGNPPASADPPAGALNTDTADRGTTETVPYARFKEVNDQLGELKGLKPLLEYGYDPDSLGQLAAFNEFYISDPIGALKAMAANIDLPQDVKDRLEALEAPAAPSSGRADGEPSGDGSRSVELPPEVQRRLDYVDRLQQREAEEFQNAQLDRAVSHWDKLDKADDLETTEQMKLNLISAAGRSGQQFETIEQMVEFARSPLIDHNSRVLGSAVQRTGRTGAPVSVPGSTSGPSAPVKFASIREASRAAEEAIKRGELPAIQP